MTLNLIVFFSPFLKISIFTFFPTFVLPTIGGSEDEDLIFFPSNVKIISPTFKSALEAGPSGIILEIKAPEGFFMPKDLAKLFVTS